MAEDMGKAELERLCAGIADKLLIGAALNIVAQTMATPDTEKAKQQLLQTAENKIPENSTLFGKLDEKQNAVLRAAIVEYMHRSLANAQTANA